jgi:putative transposase
MLRFARSSYHYRSRRDPRTALPSRIREIAAARVRYGYRKIRVLLQREGFEVSKKVVYRVYREEGLSLRYRASRRRRAQGKRPQRPIATGREPGLESRLRV